MRELDELATRLTGRFGARLRRQAPLAPFTTFGIGGPAALLLPVFEAAEFRAALDDAAAAGVPATVLGGGSNVLIADRGLDGLVVLDRTSGLAIEGTALTVASGTPMAAAALAAAEAGLAGLEFAGNLCGTVGGALRGNAGAYGREIGALLARATVRLPDGKVVEVGRDWFQFDYRASRLGREPVVLLEAVFTLTAGDRAKLREAIIADRVLRLQRHPVGFGCAGSYFRNLPPPPGSDRRQAAGALLDGAGAKRESVGGAAVFAGHANFIINRGGATATDVRTLAERLKMLVRTKYNQELTEEVVSVGAFAN